MILARCDINTCKKEVEPSLIKKATLLAKEYDLCVDCFNSLLSFIQVRLTGGRPAYQFQPTQLAPQSPFITFPPLGHHVPLSWPGSTVDVNTPHISWTSNGQQVSPVDYKVNMTVPYDQILAQLEAMLLAAEIAPIATSDPFDLNSHFGFAVPDPSTIKTK